MVGLATFSVAYRRPCRPACRSTPREHGREGMLEQIHRSGPRNTPAHAPHQVFRVSSNVSPCSALLVAGCAVVLRPFFAPIVWAGVLAYASWPLHRRLRKLLRGFNTSAALLMTLIMTCAVVLPVLWLLILVQGELSDAYQALNGYLTHGPKMLPPLIRDIP
jgi:hypothetical protein